MPDSEAKKKWDKKNVHFITAKLFITKPDEKAMLEYLQASGSVSQVIKSAIKEYIKRHPIDKEGRS